MTVRRIEQPPVIRKWGSPVLSNGMLGGRPSTDLVSDKSGLIRWARRDAAEKILANPEWLDQAEDAADLAGMTDRKEAAGRGTSIHEFVSAALYGDDLPDATDDVEGNAMAVLRWLERCVVHASELFVEATDLGFAGTLDLLVEFEGVVTVADIKSSAKSPEYAAKWSGLAWAQQAGIYSRGLPWDRHGQPVPWGDLGLPAPSTEQALVLHVSDAVVTPIRIDIPAELVDTAVSVHRLRKRSFAAVMTEYSLHGRQGVSA